MRQLTDKIKPASGFSHFVHILLNLLLPGLLFVFVRIGFFQLAGLLILLSKWRMFAVKPRHWPANIRANGVDLVVSLSFLVFMTHSSTQMMQLIWTTLFSVWILVIKPRSTTLGISVQATIGQFVGLTALYIAWGSRPAFVLVVGAWVVAYLSARHFFANFEENLTRYLSYIWAYVAAALTWVSSHWLIFYGSISQPALLLSVIGFGLGSVYYLEKTDKLTTALRRQIVFVMLAVIIVVLTFSDWGDKTI